MRKGWHPAGRLVSPDAMINAYGDVWGKLKLTGDDAEELTGFRPKKGAIGIVLRRYKYKDRNGKIKRGIFVSSLMPAGDYRLTEGMKRTHDLTRVLDAIVKEHLEDIIHRIWDPLVTRRDRKPYDGYRYFMSVNRRRIGLEHRWERMLISNGRLEVPESVCPAWYDPNRKEIRIIVPSVNRRDACSTKPVGIGIGIFDGVTGSFFHLSPTKTGILPVNHYTWKLKQVQKHYSGRGNQKSKRFCLYNYYKKQNSSSFAEGNFSTLNSKLSTLNFLYSPSIARRIKTLDKIPFSNATDKTQNVSITISLVFPDESF